MSVRAANFRDIPALARFYEESHQRSIYAERATFDLIEAKQLFVRTIQRHGHLNSGGTLVLVSEKDGAIEGFMIGILDHIYPCLKELIATDLLIIASERADPRDARTILKQLIDWAQKNPKVIEIRLGVTGAIGKWERTGKLYERIGLQQCGGIYRMQFDRTARAAA